MRRLIFKNTKNLLALVLFLSAIFTCNIEIIAQSNDTIQLIYPIPQDDGNPLNQSNSSGLYLKEPDNITHEVVYDPITGQYTFYSKIGDFMYREPHTMSQEVYAKYQNDKSISEYWKERRESSATGADKGNQLIPTIYVGGKAFDKIFGSNTIDIKLQGSADVTFGIKHQRRNDPSKPISQQRTTNFDFDPSMQLSAAAKIGEKIEFKLNYNTESQFSYDQKFTLKYEGDEDDIIQLIEAGNVSMPLSSSLITGTQSLFGIKTKLQFGKTTVTSVISYQESETQNISVNGGALTNEFEIECLDYEENRHFFLSQYFRDNYERALQDLPLVTSDININKIEVWVTNTTSNFENSRNIIAFTDLGEGKEEWIYNDEKVHPSTNFGNQYPDNYSNDMLSNMDENSIRSLNSVTSYLTSQGYTSGKDFEKLQKARKLSPSEYVFNSKLGFITLNINLNANQTLAVAYQYTVIGQDKVYQVGEFSDQSITDPNLLVTKLLKSTTINTKMPMWDLMMKNVYNMRAYQVGQNDFVMNILYLGNDNGVATGYFAEAEGDLKGKSLIHLMNVDNLNTQQNPVEGGDGLFDFINGATTNGGTINAATGRIYFPVLEPFGSHIRKIFEDNPALAEKYAFDSLYTLTKTSAEQYTEKNKFRLEGHYSSSSGSEINLNALNVSPGSVTVTAGGAPLVENVDYTVDYTLGRVTILNEALLNSGAAINISLENNTGMSTMKKSFMGARVEHEINPDFLIGGTVLHLSERAFTTKVNYNDEPLSNTIYGFDFNYQTESQLLTDLIDKLPFIETKQKSRISVYGEFAHFIQGINKENGQSGTSYIDDFEGTKSTIDLRQHNLWRLASTPQYQHELFPEAFSTMGLDYGKNRSKLSWYTIDYSVFYNRSSNILPPNITNDELSDHRVRQVLETEIFPNRDIQAGTMTNVSVLNLAYYPNLRGPYNYDTENINEDGTFSNPEDRWGGIMRAIESSDFNATNVEYIEFWMMDPFFEDGENSPSKTNVGKLYFNLGDVSEDILRDGRKSYEHGLPTSEQVVNVDTTSWGRVPSLQALVDAFDTNPESRPYQDVGYDGLSNDDEQSFFSDFLKVLETKLSPEAYEDIERDPSTDDFHHFRGSDYDSNPKYSSILERYKKYNGNEGNSPSELQYTDNYSTNYSSYPDVEDINNDNTLSESENYYQYVIDIDPNKMLTPGQNRISDIRTAHVTTINGEVKEIKWYQFRIPIREPDRVVGNIEGFSSIRFIRMFMKDFSEDIVLRFGTLDLVRGEWRTYTQAIQAPGEYQPGDNTNHTLFEQSAVNVEENSSRYPVPYVLPPGIVQEVYTGTMSSTLQNEQALQLSVENLVDGDARAVYKSTSFDFRYYENLRMYIHAEKMFEEDIMENGDLTVFLRFGSDLTDNYYEYEVPLVFTPWGTSVTDDRVIWPEENEITINFDELVEVKNNRNKSLGTNNVQTNRVYSELHGRNKIKVLGNPTISEVRSMMIGIRNPINNNEVATDKSAIIWINELRLTDLKNNGGWAATGRVEALLADLGRVTANGSYNSAGYGALETKPTESSMESNSFYSVSADIDLGKFMAPEKTGITVPIHYDFNKTTITPEYNPFDPDVKFKTALEIIEDQAEKDALNNAAKDVVKQTNFNITNLKKNRVNNGKKPHFWDIENFNATYAYTEQEQNNSDIEYSIDKTYRGGLGYTYSTNAKPVQPFANAKWASSKHLQLIKDINFYYMPKSFSFSTEMFRQYQEQKLRNKSSGDIIIRPTYAKNWDWNRTYDFRYDITKGLNFTYNASANAYIYEPAGNPERETAEWGANRDTIKDEIFGLGSMSRFNQSSKLNYTIPINKLPFLDWVTSSASYTGTYRWTASSRATQSVMGNLNENESSFQLNGNADLSKLYNKVPYFKEITTPKRQNNKGNNRQANREENTDTIKAKKNYGKIIVDNTVRVLLSVKKASFSFSQSSGVSLPGYMYEPDYLGINGMTGAPGWGFVFGMDNDALNKAIAGNWLTTDTTFNQAYSERFNETYNYKVVLEPFQDLKIDINGNRSYVENFSQYFRADANGVFNFYTPTNGGNFNISHLMVATSFKNSDELFNTMLDYRIDIANRLASENQTGIQNDPVYDTIANGYFPYGYGASSQEVLAYSFIAAYSGYGPNDIELNLFRKIALPNWSVNFTGLTKIPALKKIFKTINITHSYRSNYSISSWATNLNYSDDNPMQVYEGTNLRIPEYDMAQIVVSEQYAPLIGLKLTFNNSLSPSLDFKKNRTLTISFINNQLTEAEGQEIVIGCGYTFRNFGSSFSLGGGNSSNSSNDLTMKLDIGYRRDKTILRSIDENYSQISSGQNKVNIYLTADYDFSNRLGMQVFFRHDMTDPFVANSFKTSNTFAGVTMRFSLTQ